MVDHIKDYGNDADVLDGDDGINYVYDINDAFNGDYFDADVEETPISLLRTSATTRASGTTTGTSPPSTGRS